ncbi:Pls/PosA family non-ribosomal peptide synthetase [Arthrobacter globiformis]|uniref:Pls/PosA family non-ribosomal peptide synthetase n=1 Tax=Arthrobacter globiformis TaxID=1665 RepID=UPI00278AECF0|nr:Pls/PosA family non-ribosomal peptide synthetase [Arthrobacter globiformis]MDQ0867354.1 non-ribosomal peptide synthetase-like protein [Arthrobacter globiformis]
MTKNVKTRSRGGLRPAELRGILTTGQNGQGPVLTSAFPDHVARWSRGQRLNQLFEDRCDTFVEQGRADQLAVDAEDAVLTYEDLDRRANQLARYLLTAGARPGDRIALLFDQPSYAYVAMLGVLKTHAAYVPLDPGFPPDRLKYIVEDADVTTVLSLSHLQDLLPEVAALTICLDDLHEQVDAQDPSRMEEPLEGGTKDELAYIIYTSGSTGRPKGVAIEHASICNFVRVAAALYGIEPTDRVYQGMTIAFDFSVEEIWVSWLAGATLVPKPAGATLLGADLASYLVAKRISALCCVPTLLATIDEDLPELRFLLVSGEACPRDLVTRWHIPGRRFLNVYGPTEATVTATWALVDPDGPVSLGVPLPTYSAVILDPTENRSLPRGESGEIGLAGVGLARGYVNRPDLTEKAFVPDFLNISNNPSGRIYRTGDLGRINKDGEIEYLGRIDTQVKIRGYRIELAEIESFLLQFPGIAHAVVDTFEPKPGLVELAAFFTPRHDAGNIEAHDIHQMLRTRLPGYMVPAYYEQLDSIPMMASGKADRKRLPRPSERFSMAASGTYTAPATPAEASLAEQLGAILGLDRMSTEAHFFNDLGANSLLMAHFCARVRNNTDLTPPAMQDIYQNPTVRQLASVLTAPQPEPPGAPAEHDGEVVPQAAVKPPTTAEYVMCGAIQLAVFIGYTTYSAWLLVLGFEWASAAQGFVDMWWRSVGYGAAIFVVLSLTPVLIKWILVGRWKPGRIRIWSLNYVRYWIVKTLTRINPLVLFAGSPLYVLYLKLLGAKIGKGVVIFSRMVPACADLLTVGEGTVIHKNSFFLCARARSGVIETGPVTLGKNVLVSEKTTLDIGTSMGDDTQLGHASSLQTRQTVPAGQTWHGSPARPTSANYRRVPVTTCTTRRRVIFSLFQLFGRLFLVLPGGVLVLAALLPSYLDTGHLNPGNPSFFLEVMVLTLVLYCARFIGGLLLVLSVPRILNLFLEAEKVYPLYGIHFSFQRLIARITTFKLYKDTFGDSSYIVNYLRALGYDLGKVEQTGSNFGPEVAQESPFLCSVGTGTMVSDGLNMMNADFSSTSFRLSRVRIANRNFLGNDLTFPIGARVGENCLLATKVMIPIDGPVRTDVGLLGSPAFEIPRSVQRDAQFDELKIEEAKNRLLPAKNRHNIVSMVLFLMIRWILLFAGTLWGAVAVTAHGFLGVLAVSFSMLGFMLFRGLLAVLVERSVMGFRRLKPQYCSIYDPYFWRHERLWKLLATPPFNGTPFKSWVWRLLGVKVGKRLYDAGVNIPEKTMVTIGDDCAFNEGTAIQCHSLEDGTFKSDHIVLGNRCSLGVESFVNYGVVMGDGASLEADALLMKGEDVPEGALLVGNPARDVTRQRGTKAPSPAMSSGPRHRAAAGAPAARRSEAAAESMRQRHRATADGRSEAMASMREEAHRRSHAQSHRHRRTVSR